jgi:TonB-linked SusC/RagA family outer membrane protein
MLYCYSRKCFTAIIILTLLFVKNSYAALQQDTTANKVTTPAGWISGTVVTPDGRPLKDASVSVKGDATVVKTDEKGHFQLAATVGSVLEVSHKNYYTREVEVGATTALTIRLIDSFLQSPDKISVLYGTQSTESELGSISTVYTNQLTTTPASLFVYALAGQLTGLYTQQVSGFSTFTTGTLSTGSFGLNIVNSNAHNLSTTDNNEIGLSARGQSSGLLNNGYNNGPITIIDGVQREISSIDPESIESVSILKDGLSTILLGINSSRQVLLVTTKKAEIGAPRISFTTEYGVQQPLGLPTPLPAYQYAYLYNEGLTNDGDPPLYTASDFSAYENHTDPYGHPDVNWFNTILRKNAPITSDKLNVSGGTAIARYSISLSYFDQEGIFNQAPTSTYNTDDDMNRYVINSDVNVQVNKHLNVDLQLFGRVQQSTEPGVTSSTLLTTLYGTPNNAYPIYNPNGSFGGSDVGGVTGPYSNNLLAMSEYSGYIQNNLDDILANLDMTYDLNSLLKGLTLQGKGNLSYQSEESLNRSLQNPTFMYKDSIYTPLGTTTPQSNVFATDYTSRQSYYQGSVNYNRQFGKSSINAMLMLDSKSVTSNYDLTAVTTDRALKASYNYDSKYFIEAAINNSGYNRYPPGHQFGWFYGVGLGWQMAKESFIKDNFDWINSWKWRGTYAKTGNGNIDEYQYYGYAQTYSTSNYQYFYPTGTNRATQYTYYDNSIANPYISWETGQKLDFGADIGLFQNKLQFTADYYHEQYSNLLQVRGASIALLGTAYPVENLGINLYDGTEFTLTYKNNLGDFNYFATGNIAIQASKVVYSDEEPSPYPYNRHTGLPTTAMFGYEADGLFENAAEAAKGPTIAGYTAQAGDIKYKDLNGDGVINQFDLAPIGGLKPLIFYGLTAGFNYKGFSVSVIFQGVLNRDIDVQNNVTEPFEGLSLLGGAPNGQAYADATGRWTPETAGVASLPRLSFANDIYNSNNNQFSSFWVKSGDYFRLKNAEVGYNLPYEWCTALRMHGIRVFVNGENLYTIAGFKGQDPEVAPDNYPIQRVLNAGVSIKL